MEHQKITVKLGTVENRAARCTLTFVGRTDDGDHQYSDLGLANKMALYEERLEKFRYLVNKGLLEEIEVLRDRTQYAVGERDYWKARCFSIEDQAARLITGAGDDPPRKETDDEITHPTDC